MPEALTLTRCRRRSSVLLVLCLHLVLTGIAVGQSLDEINARLEEAFAGGQQLTAEESDALGSAAAEAFSGADETNHRLAAMVTLLDVASMSPIESDRVLRRRFEALVDELQSADIDSDTLTSFLLAQTVRPRVWMTPAKRADWSAEFRAWADGQHQSSDSAELRDMWQVVRIEQGIAVVRDSALGALTDEERAALIAQISAFLLEHGQDRSPVFGDTYANHMRGSIREVNSLSVGSVIDFEAEDLDGAPIRLADFRGNIVLLSGWATWCAPCRAIFPQEIALAEEYSDAPFALIGVNDDIQRDSGAALAREAGLNFRSIWSPSADPTAIEHFGMDGLPGFLVLDAEGRIIARARGGDEWTVQYIHEAARSAVRQLAAGAE